MLLSGASLLIWIFLAFFRGAYWQLRFFDDDIAPHDSPENWPRVACVVAARNESETITKLVESLAQQQYAGEFRIFLVDDQSNDETALLANKAATAAGIADRFTLLQAAELQAGWTGKLWALQQGVEQASAISPDYLWFTDADITHAPDTLSRLVSRAHAQKLDLTSLMVLLQAKSFPERLLIPAFLYFFLQLYPPRWTADPTATSAGAAGGCILLKRPALEEIGGLAAIRGEVIDDCALARAVKRNGGKVWMGVTRKSVSLRTYHSFAEIRDPIVRTAFTQLRYSTVVLVGTLLGLCLTYLAPVALVFSSQALVWRLSLAAWALMTVTYLPTVRFYGLSPLWAILLPVASAFYGYATGISAIRYWLGRGGEWKGRAQAPPR